MKYLIGAVFGAVLAVLPGIPAFTTWTTAVDKPFLFDLYCYEAETRGDRSACPGGRTALVAGVGALVGVAGAAVRRRFELQDSAAPQDQATTGHRPPEALTGDKDRDTASDRQRYGQQARPGGILNAFVCAPATVAAGQGGAESAFRSGAVGRRGRRYRLLQAASLSPGAGDRDSSPRRRSEGNSPQSPPDLVQVSWPMLGRGAIAQVAQWMAPPEEPRLDSQYTS